MLYHIFSKTASSIGSSSSYLMQSSSPGLEDLEDKWTSTCCTDHQLVDGTADSDPAPDSDRSIYFDVEVKQPQASRSSLP